MNIIKLDATDSTNEYLKQLTSNNLLPNFTVVTADFQTNGKGQMGSSWSSEAGKNLTMSVLVFDILSGSQDMFYLNMAVALSVQEVLKNFNVPNVAIKWPNDIMSGKQKLGGILIENSIKQDGTISSVIGIGLNVNQSNFENLPNATSVFNVFGKVLDLDTLLEKIVTKIQYYSQNLFYLKREIFDNYHQNLFRIGLPTAFEDQFENRFMAIIKNVSLDGKLNLQLEDDSLKSFGVKEIKMLL
ncbi:MAG TPA: biotin--[acetyl-CoA-carboxylase] ligase [Flavobacterium lutivivi]|nr:biotin--[acetyl-CoA-carboxylase] ligase [Flavobacterium lutivivi]